jgi:hypothetical protein
MQIRKRFLRKLVFHHREDVTHHLCRMIVVRQAVHHGNGGIGDEIENRLMLERPGFDNVYHPADDASGIFETLAFAEVNFARPQIEGMPTQLRHCDFERDARPGRRLFENHSE